MSVYTLHHGDCLDVLRAMPDASVHSIVTDPPYGLSFMGKRWDYDVPSVDVWAECLRVLKPGGHLLAFAGTRTQHRMAVRIEDAGFEIRDMIAWVYGSGFPKSLDVSKAIDKAAGAEREVLSERVTGWAGTIGGKSAFSGLGDANDVRRITAPATDAARQWSGWGTALKPALEPITVARKPLSEGTVAANVLVHGTGALNIDGCRVAAEAGGRPLREVAALRDDVQYSGNALAGRVDGSLASSKAAGSTDQGRWPANLIHDGSEHVLAAFPDVKTGALKPYMRAEDAKSGYRGGLGREKTLVHAASDGSAARFFYCAKASKLDRDEGLEGMPKDVVRVTNTGHAGNPSAKNGERTFHPRANHHPTVKPTDLMRYLCRLVTPAGGTVLDPFMGSGSTGKAAILEGFGFVGIEREADYIAIAEARIRAVCTMYDEGRAA